MPRRIAFTAVVAPGSTPVGFMVGMTEEGLGGYYPVYELGTFPTYEAAQAAADRRNESLGLTPREAIGIVLGSFREALR